MTFRRRRVAALCVAGVFAIGVQAGAAEIRVPPVLAGTSFDAATLAIVTAVSQPTTSPLSPPVLTPAVAPQAAQASANAPASGTGRVRRAAVRGALIGAGAAAVVTILAAAAYGRNEGGGICGACALQWGAAAIGAGAGIGGGIGALIGAAAPSRQHGLWPPPAVLPGRRRGVAFVVRF